MARIVHGDIAVLPVERLHVGMDALAHAAADAARTARLPAQQRRRGLARKTQRLPAVVLYEHRMRPVPPCGRNCEPVKLCQNVPR